MTYIVQYNYISISNADMINKVWRNIIIIILGVFYQLSIRRSHFGQDNSHFNIYFSTKNAPNACKHIMCTKIGIKDDVQVVFG